jgi:hypothetical protein
VLVLSVVVVRDTVLSHTGRTNSFGLIMILETSPSPDFWIIFNNSWSVIRPNPLGIHNAGYSYSEYDDDDEDGDEDVLFSVE